jgi:hypothetical protein
MKRSFAICILCAAILAACDEPAQPAAETPAAEPPVAAPIMAPADSYRLRCESLATDLPAISPLIEQLKQAVANKDASFIRNMLDENIKFSFGGDAGKEAFIQNWTLDTAPETSDFWPTLDAMLKLDGYASTDANGVVTAAIFPCTFKPLGANNWMQRSHPQISGFDYVVVIKDGAALSNKDGNLIRPLEFGETLLTQQNNSGDVTTFDGHSGYVSVDDVRSPIDYRMFLQQQDGQWKITLFIQGD